MFILFLVCIIDLILNIYQISVYLKTKKANAEKMNFINKNINDLKRGH